MSGKVARKKGFRQFITGMAIYGAVVIIQALVINQETGPLAVRVGAALLPIVAAVWAMFGWLAAIRTFDELHQKVFTESGLLALGITAVATFTYGFLESYVGVPL